MFLFLSILPLFLAAGTVDLNDAAENKTWHMVINGVNATSEDANKYQVSVDALQCPLTGCVLPYAPVSCCSPLLDPG